MSLKFIMTSKDHFEIQRSDQFLFQKVKITLIEQAVPHRGKPSPCWGQKSSLIKLEQ